MSKSAFKKTGFRKSVQSLIKQVQEIYLADDIPWVVGYSGGKDSTAALQLVWMALADLPKKKRHKIVHVITNDTLVENPIVALWVNRSLKQIETAAEAQSLPVKPHKLEPVINDTFWVKMLGWGYPAPRPKFRWCTSRLKIDPTSRFIQRVVSTNGEAIVVLGTRKAESSARAHVMEKHAQKSTRTHLSEHTSLTNAWIYPPIGDWSNDDVWTFLMQIDNPWGYDNKDLLTMYQGATEGGECPLVIDTNTQSCGNSRFGCWTCTLVDKDRSMEAMILNDEEKEWMLPLLELRNAMDFRTMGERGDRNVRDFRRMHGKVQIFNGEPIPGPYIQSFRENLLRLLLQAQQWIRANGPEEVRSIDLITLAELRKIREIWVTEKHEIEDSLPHIYEEVTGESFPDAKRFDLAGLGYEEMQLLKECCGDDEIHYQMVRELLHTEKEFSLMTKRTGLFKKLEKAIERSFFEDLEDAKQYALEKKKSTDDIQSIVQAASS
ncbi:DNA phosphorothioation system sulfurtransferase DndC [Geothermobacter hydrogeniphilus]|nr:DNA phosphorothioation system sulfurtransferase DndC [Geothermobacter hydrogeniphilus]